MAQQTYVYQDSIFHPGQSVIFQEEGKDRCAGPAKIIGVEGNKGSFIHSGHDKTVQKCRVMPAEPQKDIIQKDIDKDLDLHVKEATNEKQKKKSFKL